MGKFRVLLVDDEEELVKALAERLEIRKLSCQIALNGEEALRIVEDSPPDVMVLDLKMPGMDGMEVLRRVKKSHPEIEVLILTGHGSESDEQIARRLGAFDYLQKPVDIRELVSALERAYGAKS
ncbi:response regulator [Desulforhabdus amnigena]|uniref:Response regulator n=1 Tax=Desulforhabdus amnigena TaxID=40218 RepID=A0A9W6FRQ1_9BACT|nr:response regulator [Desulforhabdus amnigena]NLJ29766.1 response regulator [Deltaproteobacteria bacterium]GLI33229.1 response regulator [Desulforhabdus amnigena]